ncbi:MAG: STAS domain-containing protein [Gaiellaceae bacterium]
MTSPRTGVSVVAFAGEHDLATSRLTSELFDSLVRTSDLVVADVSRAQFIDSSMLAVLIAADRLARERGKDFRIQLGPEAVVKRVFHISGLLEHLVWASSRSEALNGSPPETQDDSSRGSDGAAA